MHFESRIGHLGGNLSALDAHDHVASSVMGAHDQFILSKGHAAGALYVTLWSLGLLRDAELATFHADGTLLAGHPGTRMERAHSVRHGQSRTWLSRGARHGARAPFERRAGPGLLLTSDGEWQEGAMWEALIFWAHRRLEEPLGARRRQRPARFRHHARSRLDGRARRTDRKLSASRPAASTDTIIRAIAAAARAHPGAVILLHTVKGKGVSFMENRMEWHYLPLSDAQYAAALAELDRP